MLCAGGGTHCCNHVQMEGGALKKNVAARWQCVDVKYLMILSIVGYIYVCTLHMMSINYVCLINEFNSSSPWQGVEIGFYT